MMATYGDASREAFSIRSTHATVAQKSVADTDLGARSNFDSRHALASQAIAQPVYAAEILCGQASLLVRGQGQVRRTHIGIVDDDLIRVSAANVHGEGFDRMALDHLAFAVEGLDIA